MTIKHLPRLLLAVLLGVCLGYGIARLLPGLYVTWLTQWTQQTRIDTRPLPLRCDGDQAVSDWRLAEEDLIHTCGVCGRELQIVRPGKYQCPNCE